MEMERDQVQKHLEALRNELAEVANKITDLDARKTKGAELDELHKRHEELTSQIENLPNDDELRNKEFEKAA